MELWLKYEAIKSFGNSSGSFCCAIQYIWLRTSSLIASLSVSTGLSKKHAIARLIKIARISCMFILSNFKIVK